jgi:hypothetical protein
MFEGSQDHPIPEVTLGGCRHGFSCLLLTQFACVKEPNHDIFVSAHQIDANIHRMP